MDTFSYTPDFGAKKTQKPNVTTAKFGDGYAQRYTFGLNQNPQSWALQWTNRSAAVATGMDTFLTTQNGVSAFLWTPPGQTVPLMFICVTWDVTTVKANNYSITATFDQVFEVS